GSKLIRRRSSSNSYESPIHSPGRARVSCFFAAFRPVGRIDEAGGGDRDAECDHPFGGGLALQGGLQGDRADWRRIDRREGETAVQRLEDPAFLGCHYPSEECEGCGGLGVRNRKVGGLAARIGERLFIGDAGKGLSELRA